MTDYFANTDLGFNQRTLASSFVCVDRGLHSGARVVMSVTPATPNTGIEFVRRDLSGVDNIIKARWDMVSDTQLSTTISNSSGVSVSTIEHLMAAISASGIDNARIYLDAPEVPIMDGSSAPFIEMIERTGVVEQNTERNVIVIKRSVEVIENQASASYSPSTIPWMEMSIDFTQKLIGYQHLSLPFTLQMFGEEIARARTFGFEEQLTALKQRGLAQGSSLENAILIADNQVVNESGLRYSDEFVRHKFLDAVGDLALAGHYVIGHFKGNKSGHRVNNQLLRQLFASNNWELMSLRQAHATWADFMSEQSARWATRRA
jgi:UDP-3-O-[3-hydroxymyristoyl] N-acetylglucosamine deacetylase